MSTKTKASVTDYNQFSKSRNTRFAKELTENLSKIFKMVWLCQCPCYPEKLDSKKIFLRELTNHKECNSTLAEAQRSIYALIMHLQIPEHSIKSGKARRSHRVHQLQSVGEEQHQEQQEENQTKLRPEEKNYA